MHYRCNLFPIILVLTCVNECNFIGCFFSNLLVTTFYYRFLRIRLNPVRIFFEHNLLFAFLITVPCQIHNDWRPNKNGSKSPHKVRALFMADPNQILLSWLLHKVHQTFIYLMLVEKYLYISWLFLEKFQKQDQTFFLQHLQSLN